MSRSQGHGRPSWTPGLSPVTGPLEQQHTDHVQVPPRSSSEPASAHLRTEGSGSLGTAGVKGQHAGVA